MKEMGKLMAEAIMYIEREEIAGTEEIVLIQSLLEG
jgi:hypothetical protein